MKCLLVKLACIYILSRLVCFVIRTICNGSHSYAKGFCAGYNSSGKLDKQCKTDCVMKRSYIDGFKDGLRFQDERKKKEESDKQKSNQNTDASGSAEISIKVRDDKGNSCVFNCLK